MDEAKTINLIDPRYAEILDFLYREAELMDEGHFSNWLELMTGGSELPHAAACKSRPGSATGLFP